MPIHLLISSSSRGKNTGLYNRGGQRENSSKWNKGKHSKENTAKKGKPADTIMKKNGWKTGTPLGKRGEGITAPIEATPQKDLRKIQGGIIKTVTDYDNGTQKIKFIPHKADIMYKLAAPRIVFFLASTCHAITDPPVTKIRLWASFGV